MLRLARADDAVAVADIYAPVVRETAISFELEPPEAAEVARRIVATLARFPWLVHEDPAGAVIGYAYASAHRDRAAYRWSVDVSAYVRADARRRGVARALYTALLAQLELMGYCAAHAGIALPNPASVGFHEALGFRPVGVYPAVGYKLGAWHDVGWWQRELRPRRGAPGPLLSVDEAQRQPGWAGTLAMRG